MRDYEARRKNRLQRGLRMADRADDLAITAQKGIAAGQDPLATLTLLVASLVREVVAEARIALNEDAAED